MLSVVGKINIDIIVHIMHRVIRRLLTGDEQGGFRPGTGCVHQILTLR